MILKKKTLNFLLRGCNMMASMHSFKEHSMDSIRKYLEKFSGGSVDLIKRPDGIALVTLNHKEKKNAMSGKMMVDLHDIVEILDSWKEGKGIILKGSIDSFCSGGDLDFVRNINTPEEGFMMSTFMQNILYKFQRLPMITVALIEGIAIGGGAELSTACDFILASENCKGIGFVHAKMGLLPAWGGTNRLLEKIGYMNTLELLSTAKLLSPQDCFKIGLVNEIIPAEESNMDFAISWLQKRTTFSSNLIRSIKQSVSQARDLPRSYENERRIFAPFWGGQENKEALQKNIKHKSESECR